jgi:adenosylhomocysteinase
MRAQIIVTATGCRDVVREEHLLSLPEDAIVCNVGHFNTEIDVKWLEANAISKDVIKPQVYNMICIIVSVSI